MKYVFDTYAWVEYLEGTSIGKKIEIYFSNPSYQIFTPTIVLAELSDALTKGNVNKPWEDIIEFVNLHSEKVPISELIASKAGPLKKRLRVSSRGAGIIDAIILACAEVMGATLLTGDPDLTHQEGVVDISALPMHEDGTHKG